jgi:hypothetical protein
MPGNVGKNVSYSFFICTLAYLIAAVILLLVSVAQTGWSRIDTDTGKILSSGLTLALSEFPWWGGFYYLAILVPWLGSSLLLVGMLYLFNKDATRRRLLGGLSLFAYFFSMFLAFIVNGLISGWGDIAYPLLCLWPVGGFGLGYLAVFLVEKVLPPQFAD